MVVGAFKETWTTTASWQRCVHLRACRTSRVPFMLWVLYHTYSLMASDNHTFQTKNCQNLEFPLTRIMIPTRTVHVFLKIWTRVQIFRRISSSEVASWCHKTRISLVEVHVKSCWGFLSFGSKFYCMLNNCFDIY